MPDRRRRILVGITLSEVGGAQGYVSSLLPALTESFEVWVAAGGSGPLRARAEECGARYVELRWMRRAVGPADFLAAIELFRLFRQVRPAIAHLNSSKVGVVGRLAAFAARVPVRVFTVHGWAFNAHHGLASLVYRWADRLVRPLTSAFVCPAHSERDAGVRARTCSAQRTVVIPNAVDALRYPTAPLLGDPPLISTVGRLREPKDFVTFVRALAKVEDREWSASIVGEGPDRPSVEKELTRWGLSERVELAGARNDVPALLERSDVFVLSSRSECMPLSILEAMAAGVPVVGTAVGGVPELVADGQTGLLVRPGDPVAMARAVRALLESPTLRRRLGAAGRKRAEAEFGLDAFRAAHLELFEREAARAGVAGTLLSPDRLSCL